MDGAKAIHIQTFAYTLFTLIVLVFPPAMCDDEGEFNYDLSSKYGPFNWGNIRPNEWYLCKNGTRQSPINLEENRANLVFNSGIQRNYRPANANLRSTDHDIMVNWTENAGYISINGTQYQLDQCHWHSPSEHAINGKRYDLELHMVHRSSNGRIAVVGILYKIGRRDRFISTIEDDLRLMAENQTRETQLGIVDPEQVAGIAGKNYFRYNGSLTVPPCDENVLWTVYNKEVRFLSSIQN
ncbi:Alpha carbonic anhydrase 7, partial [Mucuna pruriens]